MDDPTLHDGRDRDGDADGPRHADDDGGMPRWVKAFVIAGIVVTALIVLVVLVAGGDHGPGRHLPGSGGADAEAPAGDALPGSASHG